MNNITTLSKAVISDFQHLRDSLEFAAQTKFYLDNKKQWTFTDWLLLIGSGAYVATSVAVTINDGEKLIDAVTSEINTEKLTLIPAKMHFKNPVKKTLIARGSKVKRVLPKFRRLSNS